MKRSGMKNKNALMRRRVWNLKDIEVRNNFKQRVEEPVDMHSPDLWKTFKDGVLKACDELCGKKMLRRKGGNTWLWNEEVKDVIARKKEPYKTLRKSKFEGNWVRYKAIRSKAKKLVAGAMKKETEKEMKNCAKLQITFSKS